MNILDRPEIISRYDKNQVLDSIRAFADQIVDAWAGTRKVAVPKNYQSANSVVVLGMGGSGWPSEVVRTYLSDKLRVPMTVYRDYCLPASVDRNTLVILSTYSGTTEEPLAAYATARRRRAKIMVVTLNHALAISARRFGYPCYNFSEKYNPSKQPRLGTGYMLFGVLGLMERAGLIKLTSAEVGRAVQAVKRRQKQWSETSPYYRNQAKQLASRLKGRIGMVIAAEHLEATAEGFRNRINENAKQLAVSFKIPDLNHHLLEGLEHPKIQNRLYAIFLDSPHYHPRNRRRVAITQKVFQKYRVPAETVCLAGRSKLEDILLVFAFSGFQTFWLAMLNGVDPQKIPWVDYFKAQLGR